jgi:hypothetical protein
MFPVGLPREKFAMTCQLRHNSEKAILRVGKGQGSRAGTT